MKKQSSKKAVADTLPWIFFGLTLAIAFQVIESNSIDAYARQQASLNWKNIERLEKRQNAAKAGASSMSQIQKIYSALNKTRNPSSVREID